MRTPRTATAPNSAPKSGKKDGNYLYVSALAWKCRGVKCVSGKTPKQGSGPRSNSSLSSREVEFQNWKRRKSYDPMKAAAEGKKKEIEKRLGPGAATAGKLGMASPDSSPSHSGSVHRSQVSFFQLQCK